MSQLKKISVYTDGSCIGNPGPGGWAFLIPGVLPKTSSSLTNNNFHHSGFAYHSTNNRMEMTAILEALKYLAKNFPYAPIELNSDSNLLIQTLNQGWKRKANLDLWAEIDQFRKNLQIKYFWVKAHADNHFNNLCDRYAQEASAKALQLIKKQPHLAEEAQYLFTQISTPPLSAKLTATKKPGPKKSLPSDSGQAVLF